MNTRRDMAIRTLKGNLGYNIARVAKMRGWAGVRHCKGGKTWGGGEDWIGKKNLEHTYPPPFNCWPESATPDKQIGGN